MSLTLGCAALGVLMLGKKLLPSKPIAWFVVIGGIAAASVVDFGAQGMKLLGEVPRSVAVPSLLTLPILYQKLFDQPLFFFQLVDACVNFTTAEIIQRHVWNNLPRVTHSTNGE